MSGRVLITGADGYIGQNLAKQILAQTDMNLVFLLRAQDQITREGKLQRLQAHYNAQERERIQCEFADLAEPLDAHRLPLGDIHSVIHTAAITRFNVSERDANQVNRDGTRQILELARRCSGLQKYVQISTLYATGLHSGYLPEFHQPNQLGFANHYECSKYEAESILLQEFADLPWVLPRVATIVADGDSGEVSQFNVFHNTLRLLFMGLTSIMPGDSAVPLYFVTGKFVTDALFSLWQQPKALHNIVQVCAPATQCVSVGLLIDLVFDEFAQDENFRKRRILKPLLTDYEAFTSLADTLDGMAGMVVRQALESMRPFAKQMFVNKNFDNSRLQALWPGYEASHQGEMLRRVVRYLLATRWGSVPVNQPSMELA